MFIMAATHIIDFFTQAYQHTVQQRLSSTAKPSLDFFNNMYFVFLRICPFENLDICESLCEQRALTAGAAAGGVVRQPLRHTDGLLPTATILLWHCRALRLSIVGAPYYCMHNNITFITDTVSVAQFIKTLQFIRTCFVPLCLNV